MPRATGQVCALAGRAVSGENIQDSYSRKCCQSCTLVEGASPREYYSSGVKSSGKAEASRISGALQIGS